MSRIPTGVLSRYTIPNSIQKFLWLRSPYTDYDLTAWQVNPSGVVFYGVSYNVDGSYGREYRRARRKQIMYVMCFLLVELNIDTIFT